MHIKTQNWKERFDKKFSSEWWNGFGTTDDINKGGIESIKSFITSLLEERDLKWKMAMLGVITNVSYEHKLSDKIVGRFMELVSKASDLLEEKK